MLCSLLDNNIWFFKHNCYEMDYKHRWKLKQQRVIFGNIATLFLPDLRNLTILLMRKHVNYTTTVLTASVPAALCYKVYYLSCNFISMDSVKFNTITHIVNVS